MAPSLSDTAGRLVSVRGLADKINTTLNNAQSVNSLGTNGIWRRVRFINGGPFRRPGDPDDQDNSLAGPGQNTKGLSPVETDTSNIKGGLTQVNIHLTSICESPTLKNPVVQGLGLARSGPC